MKELVTMSSKISRLVFAVLSIISLVINWGSPVYAINSYPTDTIPVHRFYNLKTGTHFYTAVQYEASLVNDTMSSTYRYEGVGFYAYSNDGVGRTAMYRFYNFKNGTHFYTPAANERDDIIRLQNTSYRYEGVSYYAATADKAFSGSGGLVAVHRFYNFQAGTHFYTAVQTEASNVNNKMSNTYRYEGISYAAIGSYYSNCTEARLAGAAPMLQGEIGYRVELDRDRDGSACDITGQ